jgi:hypothetical protein
MLGATVAEHDVFKVFVSQKENAVDNRHHGSQQPRAYPAGERHAIVRELVANFIVKVAGKHLFVSQERGKPASHFKHDL